MQWFSVSSAWFGLSAFIIIAMYMLKKRYEQQTISSTLLWRRALQEQEANKPWQRLRNRLLLWLQIIIAIIVVIALMEPALQKQLAKDNHLIIVLDTSFSSHAITTDSGNTYFQESKQAVKNWLKEASAGSPISLITNGEYPKIITSHETDTNKVLAELELIQPYYGISEDQTTVSLARSLASHDDKAIIFYFVDTSFKGLQEFTENQTINEQWQLIGDTISTNQMSIRSFSVQNQSETRAEALITISHPVNTSEALQLTVGSYSKDKKLLNTVEKKVTVASSSKYTTTTVTGLEIGDYYKVELAASATDHNAIDNVMYSVMKDQATTSALLVSDGNLFLEKALQLMNVKVTKQVPSGEPPTSSDLEPIQFVIVDGDYNKLAQSDVWRDYMQKYPLWIIDHPQSSDPSSVIPSQLEVEIQAHEVTQYISFDDIYIAKLKELTREELAFGASIVTYGGFPAIIAGYEHQMPRLRYTFSFADSDLPLRADFPILMMQSIQYMSLGTGQSLGSYMVDEEPTVTYSPSTSVLYWRSIDSLFKTEDSRSFLINDKLTVPSIPGVYTLIEENEQGEILQSRIAVVHGDAYDFTVQAGQLQPSSEQSKPTQPLETGIGWQSLIPLIAIFLLLALLAEWEVYRRGL